MSYARAKYVVAMNNDVFPDERCFDTLLATAKQSEDIAVVGCKIIQGGSSIIDHMGGIVFFPSGLTYGRFSLQLDSPSLPNAAFETPFVGGALMFMRRDCIREIRGFDSMYFLSYEEVDLCWRARMAGYRVICDPRAVATHYSKSSTGKVPGLRLYFMERNRMVTSLKCLGTKNLIVNITFEVFYGFAIILGSLARREARYLRIYLKAIGWILGHLRVIYVKRRWVGTIREVPDGEVLLSHTRITLSQVVRLMNLLYARAKPTWTPG